MSDSRYATSLKTPERARLTTLPMTDFAALQSWLTDRPETPQEEQQVFGRLLLRVENVQRKGRLAPVKKFLLPIAVEALAARGERMAVQHRNDHVSKV
jgi:hypothetical protein